MAVKIRKGNGGQIDFTPMIDMVFNLLIFFMVTTKFSEEDHEIPIKTPNASEAPSLTASPQDVFVVIDDAGNFFVKGKQYALDDLEAYLLQKKADDPVNTSVKIRADGRVSVQPLISVMNACNKADIRDYTVVTQSAEK